MKRFVLIMAIVASLVAALAAPAFASTGREYGEHHSEHAREMGGFSKDMNPGTHHKGFAGWAEHHEGGHEGDH